VDIHFLRLEREYGVTGDEAVLREARECREQEIRLASLSDQVWCVTPADGEVLAREARASEIKIIPVPHAPQGRGLGFDERQGILFVGNFNHSPNRDAVRYFVGEVFPLVRVALPGVKFYVVGDRMTDEIVALHSEDVVVKGFVPDLAPLLKGCRVFVAPLRFGAGMKGKIVQALAYGLPTVTTPIGAEGIGLRHMQEALIADSAEEFAAAVVELYGSRELWRHTSEAGYGHVSAHYAPEIVEAKILAAMRELGGERGDAGVESTAAAGLRPLVQS
jgi:glycosyltransferase involved in cell wall biosynthesis